MSDTRKVKTSIRLSQQHHEALVKMSELTGSSRNAIAEMAIALFMDAMLKIAPPQELAEKCTNGSVTPKTQCTNGSVHWAETTRNKLLKPGDNDQIRSLVEEVVELGPGDASDPELAMSRAVRMADLMRQIATVRRQSVGNTTT